MILFRSRVRHKGCDQHAGRLQAGPGTQLPQISMVPRRRSSPPREILMNKKIQMTGQQYVCTSDLRSGSCVGRFLPRLCALLRVTTYSALQPLRRHLHHHLAPSHLRNRHHTYFVGQIPKPCFLSRTFARGIWRSDSFSGETSLSERVQTITTLHWF